MSGFMRAWYPAGNRWVDVQADVDGKLVVSGGGGGGGSTDSTAANQLDQIDEAVETNTRIGATNETVAAADNSVSGLNGLIKRLLGKFTTQFPAALGSQTGAASLGVALSTEDATTQTTISTNTGNTATNTSAISGKLPASVGQKAMAVSLPVVLASDQSAIPVTSAAAVATSISILTAVTGVSTGAAVTTIPKGVRTWFAFGTTSSGSGLATISIEGSIDGTNWRALGSFSLVLATTVATDTNTDAFTDRSSFVQYRGRVATISGTGAAVTVKVGV